eukprot:TRINITY_DN45966_c0_g1_i1.p1 TRINITY_DN45966_c0_g1~~TRINITY_DN45966_c0_g1_i1.p1  ORF type:complete len:371 (+),score=37.94 TRINITY_DN45966_c0_g1_i1:145-1257(+)
MFYRQDKMSASDVSEHLAVEDMMFAASLFEASIRYGRCFDTSLDIQKYLLGSCQPKLSMMILILNELGAAAASQRELRVSMDAFRLSTRTFAAMKNVPYHSNFGDIGWRQPTDIALNDELYPRTFGAVWPKEHVPFGMFLEEHYEVFKADLEAILAQDGLFDYLRQLDRNAEGLAVWPPDTRGHVELLSTREQVPFKAGCSVANATCALLASRPELVNCPRAAAFFARLRPGAWLKPHLGNSRRMAAHLGLIIPDGDIQLNVGSARKVRWEAGKAIVWDDTHVHDARHYGSEGTRYILQTFFCHPCEQKELYLSSPASVVQNLANEAACTHKDPVRAEISQALRAEMDMNEQRQREATKMVMPMGGPVGV